MNVKKRPAIFGAILVLSFTGLVVMANTLSYKQTSCKYSAEDKYIWIKFDNGVQEKGISFVSDGVIFDSSIVGMTYAKDYPDIIGVIYGKGEKGLGLLSIDLIENDGPVERENIGSIDEQCWNNLKSLLSNNPVSNHIKIFDEGLASRNRLN